MFKSQDLIKYTDKSIKEVRRLKIHSYSFGEFISSKFNEKSEEKEIPVEKENGKVLFNFQNFNEEIEKLFKEGRKIYNTIDQEKIMKIQEKLNQGEYNLNGSEIVNKILGKNSNDRN